jgi:recombination protein RecT
MNNELTTADAVKTEIVKEKPRDIALAFIDNIKAGWLSVLPKVCTPERFARVALTCIKKDSKLREAIQTPEGRSSLAGAFMKCAELGIEPDGRRAYLIPYKNDVQLIIDYKGIAELAMRSGFIANIHADKVCEDDEFEYNIGVIERHRIDFKKPRGDAYAYYAVVTFKDGTKKTEVMSRAEVDAIKERSSAWGAWLKWKKVCPWNTDYDEMAKKTVFKRLAKWIPQSSELQKAIDFDNDDYRRPIAEVTPEEEPEQTYEAVDLETGEISEAKDDKEGINQA